MERALKRKLRTRKKILGVALQPRLSVAKTLKHTYAQLIDDTTGHTLLFVSTLSPDVRSQTKEGGNVKAANLVGELLGKKAISQGITRVVFDRGSSLYHGRVRAVAEAARAAGLKF